MSHINYVIKRDGRRQAFSPKKLSHWAEWADEKLGLDWEAIAAAAYRKCNDGCKTIDLQQAMIDTCVNDNASTAHQKFAGRLFIGNLYHELYGNEWSIPTVREQHEKLLAKGMVEDLHFTDEEWEEINSFVDHKRDLDMKYSQVVQIVKKYVLTDVKTGKPVESPQFTFMRQACWYASKDNKGDTLTTIKDIYELLSKDVLCAPTPDHLYINTPKGVAPSCVVIRGGDSLQAISAALTATMECSASGSGIGMSLELRSPTDPVGTSTTHAGKHAYYNAVDAMARANKQAGRAGAVTTYYTCLDPELLNIARWKNPTTPPDVRLGDLDYAFGANDAFADAVREDKPWMLVSCYYAPKLWELLYQPDKELFNTEYERVKADSTIPKKFVSARKILFSVLRESVETRQYEYFTDELNRHTPFKEKIYSSNLCVSGDTLILTDKGNVVISDVVDQTVNVWNGEEWSETVVRKTGENQSLVRVMLKSGKFLDCTPYHKFYVLSNYSYSKVEVRAGDLNEGDRLIAWWYPDKDDLYGWCAPETVVSVSPVDGLHDTYCFNEPKRHMGVFNGILTGQCTEIALPTKSFNKGTIELHDPNSEGEIATCNLMGINVATINGDLDLYYKAAYYALLMCRIKIIHGNYPFASMKRTAIARLSAGVSMISVAHLMAKNGMKYSSLWGKKFFHRLAETHSYMLHKAALEIGKKYGLPEWIDRTKYPDGWLPIDTRNKYAMEIAHQPLKHDWETLRKEIVEAGGIGFSVLETAVPSESSSQAQDATNGWYPIRAGIIEKRDASKQAQWIAPQWEELKDQYEIAWEISEKDMIDIYAIGQCFTGQAISADLYLTHHQTDGKIQVSSSKRMAGYLYRKKVGLKSRYYFNHQTNGVYTQRESAKCASGGCEL